MSIERAIQKAKQRIIEQQAAQGTQDGRTPVTTPHADKSRLHKAIRPVEAPLDKFQDLGGIVLDPAKCELNRILLFDGVRSDLARAEPSYRLLRSCVQHAIAAGNWTCVGITSPGPGEGKTVTTLNLAVAIAREKQRSVFLLDLDMRNPSVFKYLGAKPAVQMSDYLVGAATPEQVLYTTGIDNLVMAGNTEPIAGASELLATQRLNKLLGYIHTRAPGALVLIDLPPVTSTDEALEVAPRANAMFLVVSEGQTRRDALVQALSLLSNFNVAGIILNRATEHLGNAYYYY